MKRNTTIARWMAALAVLGLLWCHGLDVSAHAQAADIPAADTVLAAASPGDGDPPAAMGCAFAAQEGGAPGTPLTPATSAGAVLDLQAFLPDAPGGPRYAHPALAARDSGHGSLVSQAVLLRI